MVAADWGALDYRLAPTRPDDPINHPRHYQHPSGIEVIQITETMGFCLGNVVKYVLRAGRKPGTDALTDLEKASWYLDREIQRRTREGDGSSDVR